VPNQKPAPKGVKKPTVKKEIPKESKSEMFLRLAPLRVEKVLKSLRILGNCSNANYEYTSEQIDKIAITLSKALEQTMLKFHAKEKNQDKFEF